MIQVQSPDNLAPSKEDNNKNNISVNNLQARYYLRHRTRGVVGLRLLWYGRGSGVHVNLEEENLISTG